MGVLLKYMGKFNESYARFERSLLIRPRHTPTQLNYAHALEENGLYRKAMSVYKEAHADATEVQQRQKALCELFLVEQRICEWNDYEWHLNEVLTILQTSLSDGAAPCMTPPMALFCPFTPLLDLEIARSFSQAAQNHKTAHRHEISQHSNHDSDSVIHVGFISNYMRDHIVAHLIGELFRLHDRTRFKFFVYALNPPDSITASLESMVEKCVDGSKSTPEKLAEEIRADDVYILIDLDGHMPGNAHAILALQPAPIQISYLGFPGSTSAPYIQYIIADHTIVADEQFFSEKIIYMPHSYIITNHRRVHNGYAFTRNKDPSVRKGDHFVFCSLNQLIKLDPETFRAWLGVVAHVPGAQLWLLSHPADAEEALMRFAASVLGSAEAASQVIFHAHVPSTEEHFERLSKCDIFLDTHKYGSHATGLDVLWSGVPLLTFPGTRFASRVGASLVRALDLDGRLQSELVVSNVLEFQHRAVQLAKNATRLGDIKSLIEQNKHVSPLFDSELWVEDFQRAMQHVWRSYILDMPADNVHVASLRVSEQ